MKIAQIARQLKKAMKEHSKLEEKISKFSEAAGIAAEQNLECEFEMHLQKLYDEEASLRSLIGDLGEELGQCIANGDLEKGPRLLS
jgi:hypothetical protein